MFSHSELEHREPHVAARLLIVEDEPHGRRALRALLCSRGYRVEVVGSAEQAMELLQREHLPDAVLLDVDLPGMDGLELLNRLQTLAPRVVPVIVSAVDPDRVRPATDRGVRFVRKPINFPELLLVLGAALSRE